MLRWYFLVYINQEPFLPQANELAPVEGDSWNTYQSKRCCNWQSTQGAKYILIFFASTQERNLPMRGNEPQPKPSETNKLPLVASLKSLGLNSNSLYFG